MHPSIQVPREYAVRVRGTVTEAHISALTEGVLLDDGMARFNDIVYSGGENQNQWYHVVLLEGRNREVRRLWESQGLTVSRLKRVRYGTIVLTQRIRQGTTTELNEKEISSLEDMLSFHEKDFLTEKDVTIQKELIKKSKDEEVSRKNVFKEQKIEKSTRAKSSSDGEKRKDRKSKFGDSSSRTVSRTTSKNTASTRAPRASKVTKRDK